MRRVRQAEARFMWPTVGSAGTGEQACGEAACSSFPVARDSISLLCVGCGPMLVEHLSQAILGILRVVEVDDVTLVRVVDKGTARIVGVVRGAAWISWIEGE